MKKKQRKNQTTPSVPSIDYRSSDDAWYAVSLIRKKETLILKYCDFPDNYIEKFNFTDFNSSKDLDDFGEKFRPTSIQLQDEECRRLMEGMTVCASSVLGKDDIRFYDALVESVCFSEHEMVNGEEVCCCTFEIHWKHGPNAGTKATVGIENICLLQCDASFIHPALDYFLKMSRKRLEGALQMTRECEESSPNKPTGSPTIQNVSTNSKHRVCLTEGSSSPLLNKTEATRKGKRSHEKLTYEDMDLGGGYIPKSYLSQLSNYYFIVIENLEKDLSPSTIVDFIYQNTSVMVEAHVSPSYLSESYARGAIILENQENLDKLLSFLNDPTHLIMSSVGRPWVVPSKKWRHGNLSATVGSLLSKTAGESQLSCLGCNEKLKLVHEGTEEYHTGKQRMELFLEFWEHIQILHGRLAFEEKRQL